MNKASRLFKRYIALILVLLFSIESFAAVVGDNDGAAFITKAEFDSMKNDFQSQLDRYNSSLDNKIDGAIASYLAGVKVSVTQEHNIMMYGGARLGLLENYYSRPYIEGRVGGELTISSFVTYGGNADWVTGVEWGEADKNKTMAVPTYLALCFHRLFASSEPFEYLVADYASHDGSLVFDLFGYCKVSESLNATLSSKNGSNDNTAEGDYSIGLCEGVTPKRWNLLTELSSKNGALLALCEVKCKKSNSNYARGAEQAPRHNRHIVTWDLAQLTSSVTKQNQFVYITNVAGSTAYNGVRVRDWSGANKTASSLEPHTAAELLDWGWRLRGTVGGESNYHIKLRTASNFGYACGFGAYDRLIGNGYTEDTPGFVPASQPHGVVPDSAAYQRLYKADVGDVCRVNNMYSSELADVIKEKLQSKIITVNFEGTQRDLAPLYLGLPIVDVNVDDIVELHLNLLDASTYDIGFYIDGFDNVAVQNSSFANAGCQVDGSPNNRKQITGPNSNAIIKIRINKKGILFLKYGATGTNAQSIQLPLKCSVTTN